MNILTNAKITLGSIPGKNIVNWWSEHNLTYGDGAPRNTCILSHCLFFITLFRSSSAMVKSHQGQIFKDEEERRTEALHIVLNDEADTCGH